MPMNRRDYLFLSLSAFAAAGMPLRRLWAQETDWTNITAAARGQEVHFHAWAGDERINAYIGWAAQQIKEKHNVTLQHIKLSDTAEAVSRVIAEKSAGRDRDGSVDLIWLNGENFAALKNQHLLYGPFTQHLPNVLFIDQRANPALASDFTIPVDGMEAPWGFAQLVFFYHSKQVSMPPQSMHELLEWAKAHKGRFTYPAPPEFLGTTFLKQILLTKAKDKNVFAKEANGASFADDTASLWAYLDKLHPFLWHEGKTFPKNAAQLRQLVADGETDIYFAFNPGDASSAMAQGLLPKDIKPIAFKDATMANAHFLAIPYNAKAKEGAMVAVNFLLSPLAQARKQDPTQWGDPTVLSLALLMPEDRSKFEKLPLGSATPRPDQLSPKLTEPHPSWVKRLEEEWARRYAA